MQGKPSKSALKRQQHALQALGEELIKLPEERLRGIPLDDDLFAAIRSAARMTAHGALRRQRQLVGKLMRRVDPEPIRAALDAATRNDRQSKATFRQAELWRDRIVAEGRSELNRFLADTGADAASFVPLVDELAHCRTGDELRVVARRLFRAIHQELGAKMHNATS